MPKQSHGDIEHTVTTDHWIRREPKPVHGKEETESGTGNEIAGLEDFFHVAKTGDLGIANVRYGIAMARPPYVTRGIRLLGEASREQPESSRWQYWLGCAMRNKGDLVEARRLLESALSSDVTVLSESERIGTTVELAQLYLQVGMPKRALELCDRLLRTDPDCFVCHELGVQAQAQLGDPAAVLRRVRAGLELNPTSHYLWGMLGLGQFSFEKDAAAARNSLERALQLEPLEVTTYLILAEVLESQQKIVESESILKRAIDLEPESIVVLLATAKFYVAQGRQLEAGPILRRVLALSPDNSDAIRLLHTIRQ